MSRHLKPLDRLTAADEARSGAKAYNCARLKQAGFRVPDGLVVLSTATAADLDDIARDPWVLAQPPAARFAVRSSGIGEDSAGQSFAGIHQTTLDVARSDLSRAVADCRASARTPQALEYRRAKGLPIDDIHMGVLIQRMIQPVAAGVAFTVNPITGAADELVINSSWGVGEALVSGLVDPDEFVVRKRDGTLLFARTGEKADTADPNVASLSSARIAELARILIDIERHYGAPQDVEWCQDGSGFWIVQSRPVTAAAGENSETEWTRANLAEVLPDITSPQALTAFEDLLNRAQQISMRRLAAPEQALGPMLKTFYGRLYFNLSQLRHIGALAGTPPAVMLRSLGHADAIHAEDETATPVPVRARLAALPDFVRLAWRHLRADTIVARHDAWMREYLLRIKAVEPRALPDDELWALLDGWYHESPVQMQTVLLLAGVLFHEEQVRKVCEKVGFPFERLVYPQLAAGERSVSAQQAFDLTALAARARREPGVIEFLTRAAELADFRTALAGTRFLAEFEGFLETYGHRGRYESDWSLPRYSEDPRPLLRAVGAHLQSESESSGDIADRQARESADAWTAFAARLSPWQRWMTLPRVRRSVRRIKQYYLWRERVRSDLIKVLAVLRTWHLELARRFVERGWLKSADDYFLVHLTEIGSAIAKSRDPRTLAGIAADRAAETARYRSISMPLLMRESELPRLIRMAGVSSRSDDERLLSGHPVAAGCVEAEVVVVRDPGDFGRMKAGAILVAPATDPSWTPLFTLASGVIVEVGGVLSHASTIAREYGLPALANVKHATRRLRTGERVRLDANQGIVERLTSSMRSGPADAPPGPEAPA